MGDACVGRGATFDEAVARGYSSLTLQHDVAEMLLRRHAQTGQMSIVYFISDHDPSGFDLQRAWQEALANFGAPVRRFVRIALTTEQVRDTALDIGHDDHANSVALAVSVLRDSSAMLSLKNAYGPYLGAVSGLGACANYPGYASPAQEGHDRSGSLAW